MEIFEFSYWEIYLTSFYLVHVSSWEIRYIQNCKVGSNHHIIPMLLTNIALWITEFPRYLNEISQFRYV